MRGWRLTIGDWWHVFVISPVTSIKMFLPALWASLKAKTPTPIPSNKYLLTEMRCIGAIVMPMFRSEGTPVRVSAQITLDRD